LEIILTLAVLAIILVLILPAFGSLKQNQVFNNAIADTVSAINKARAETLSSFSSSEYGVHLESSQVVIFKGTVYTANDPNNEVIILTSPASITDVTLGGVSGASGDFYFARLSGAPNKSGTVTIAVPGSTKIITITQAGTVSKN